MNAATPFVHHPQSLLPPRKRLLTTMAVTAFSVAVMFWLGMPWPSILALYAVWVLFDLVDYRTRQTSVPLSVKVEGEHIDITRLRFFSCQPQTDRYPLSDCRALATFYDPSFHRLHTQLFLKRSYKAPITLDFHPPEEGQGRFFAKTLRRDCASTVAFRQAMAQATGLRNAGFIDCTRADDVIKAVYKT